MIPVMNYSSLEDSKTKITQFIKPKYVYNNLANFFISESEKTHQTVWHYPKCTLIPNTIKVPDSPERELLAVLLSNKAQNKLVDLIPIDLKKTDTNKMIIHAPTNNIILLIAGTLEPIKLPWQNSISITNGEGRERNMQIHTNQPNTLIVIELHKPETELIPNTKVIKDWVYNINQTDLKSHYSFNRKRIPRIEDEHAKILCVAAQYVITKGENETVLVSISIENYEGKLLVNSIVTPRQPIKHFQSHSHGLKEADILGRWDEHLCKIKLHRLLDGKIVVGCNVYELLKALGIPTQRLLGIRDLSNGRCFEKLGLTRGHNAYRLDYLTKHLCPDFVIPKTDLKSEREVRKINSVYHKIEMKWEDHILPILEEDKQRAVIPESPQKTINQPLSKRLMSTVRKIIPMKRKLDTILEKPSETNEANKQCPVEIQYSLNNTVETNNYMEINNSMDIEKCDELGAVPNITIEDEEMQETFFQPPAKSVTTHIKTEPTVVRRDIIVTPVSKFRDIDDEHEQREKFPRFSNEWVPPITRFDGEIINKVSRVPKSVSDSVPTTLQLDNKSNLCASVYQDEKTGAYHLITYY